MVFFVSVYSFILFNKLFPRFTKLFFSIKGVILVSNIHTLTNVCTKIPKTQLDTY